MTATARQPFDDVIANACAAEAAAAKNDPERFAAMIERLARALGFSIAMASKGDAATIDRMIAGAEAYAHDEAVDKSRLAKFMAQFP